MRPGRRLHRRSRFRLGARAALLWLLALVVPMQCGAALSRAVAGPAHTHPAGASASAPLLLQDFRRGMATLQATPTPPGLHELLHGHRHLERHHHAPGDASAVIVRDSVLDRADALDDGGTASSGAFSGLVPLLAAWPAWQGSRSAEALPAATAWQPSSHVGTPLERPPRRLPG